MISITDLNGGFKMKWFKVLLATLLLGVSQAALCQSAVIRGESTPGNYVNVKTDSTGNLYTVGVVSGSAGVNNLTSATNTALTVTGNAATFGSASSTRKYMQIQNNDTTAIIWVNFAGTATVANGIKLGPGQIYAPLLPPTTTFSAIASVATASGTVIFTDGQ
jgi:hypothetical protein